MTNQAPAQPDGAITLDATGERIGPRTTAGEFAGLRAACGTPVSVGRGRSSRAELARIAVQGAEFNLTAVFDGVTLARLELFMRRAADGSTWADWSPEAEMLRKSSHESWAARVFGAALAPKPLALDRHGQPIIPEPLTWEHPRHAVFGWGEVVSSYDSKAGMAVLIVRYGEVPPLERA